MTNITLDVKNVILMLLNKVAFSTIVFIWFILYRIGLIEGSPLFALLITFIQNLTGLIINNKKNKINKTNILRYSFILFIMKILPLLHFFPNYLNFDLRDIFIVIYLYSIYLIFAIIMTDLFDLDIKIDKIIHNDTIGDNYEKAATTRIYDFTYNQIIDKII